MLTLGSFVILDFEEQALARGERGLVEGRKATSHSFWVPLVIQRDEGDLEAEVEVLDFYVNRGTGWWGGPGNDDPSEADIADEAVVVQTGRKVLLTPEERMQAEAKFLAGIKKTRPAHAGRVVEE